MKSIITRITLLTIIFFLWTWSLNAQQFKWVKGGGTSQAFSLSSDLERTRFMCTDPNGNIYAVSKVGNNAIYADTFYRSGAYGVSENMLITSYTCNGQMRWAKLIASSAGQCRPTGLVADSLGNVYVSGFMFPGTLYIGYDTTIGPFYMHTGLVQFDTSGNFNWIRWVGDNTMATYLGTAYPGCPLAIDGANNLHFFNYMKAGVPITSTVTSIRGTYDLIYSSTGTLLSQTRLDLDSAWYLHGAVIDPITNKLYGYGEINFDLFGGSTIDTFYAAAFDASRNRLWQYFCGHGGDDAITGLVMDRNKHLLFSGASQGGGAFSFNGDSVSGVGSNLAIVMKTDTNGTVKWLKHFSCIGSAINAFYGITLLNNNKVAAVGMWAGRVVSGYDSIVTPAGEGWNPYLVIVNSDGDLQKIEGVRGNGFSDRGSTITSDRVGNIYCGGVVVDSIWGDNPIIPAYHSVGGGNDFFIMKYGMDCSCTTTPISAFIDTGTHTIGVNYTGTTVGIDSVVWTFGDGYRTTGTSAIHTYATADTFRACATVYTNCGNDIHCTDVVILIPSLISPLLGMPNIKAYPNPANNELNVTGISENTGYRLLSITGEQILQGILLQGNSTISMKNLAAGIYILEMTTSNGERCVARIVKEL